MSKRKKPPSQRPHRVGEGMKRCIVCHRPADGGGLFKYGGKAGGDEIGIIFPTCRACEARHNAKDPEFALAFNAIADPLLERYAEEMRQRN
jgi:hypothetical protein